MESKTTTKDDSKQNGDSITENETKLDDTNKSPDSGSCSIGIGHSDTSTGIDAESLDHAVANNKNNNLSVPPPSLTDSNNENHDNGDRNNDDDNDMQKKDTKTTTTTTTTTPPMKELRRSSRRRKMQKETNNISPLHAVSEIIVKPSSSSSPQKRKQSSTNNNSSSISSSNSNDEKRPKRKRKITEKAQNFRMQEIEKVTKIQKEKKQRVKRTKKKQQKGKNTSTPTTKPNKGKGKGQAQKGKEKKIRNNRNDNHSTTSSLDEKDIICCVCNCGVDFSEREAFQNHDESDDNSSLKCIIAGTNANTNLQEGKMAMENNDKDTNHDKKESIPDKDNNNNDDDESSLPYDGVKLPKELYDRNNALIICDTPGCNRSYHQRCHFVPVFCLPRGKWHCLICQMKEKILKEKSSSKKRKRKPSKKISSKQNVDVDKLNEDEIYAALSNPLTIAELDSLYPIPRDDINALSDDKKQHDTDKRQQKHSSPLVSLQERFEFQSASLKATILNTELKKRIKSTIDSALSNVRLEEHTIRGCTETERAKKSLMDNITRSKRIPQQLVQSVDRMAHSKMRIRALMLSMDCVIRNRDDRKELFDWFQKEKTANCTNNDKVDWDLLESKLFFGDERRKEPRFDIADYDGDIEDETDEEDPTQKIKCSVCFNGQVHPNNDVIMCDGKNCFRAFHMKCCNPIVTQKMLDDDEQGTWFCPYCCALANSIHYTQVEYFADEMDDGEEFREEASANSWDEAEDVFPEAVVEMSSAQLWKSGRRNDVSDKYLGSLLGVQLPNIDENDDSGSDDDSDHNFSMTDVEENGSFSDSSSSSSISGDNDVQLEWEVDKDEIEALSCLSSQESLSSDDQGESTRRTRSSIKAKEESSKDIGTIDEKNIIHSKRNRTKVDYRRLNGSLFGDMDKFGKNSELDDEDEYDGKKKRRKRFDNSDSE